MASRFGLKALLSTVFILEEFFLYGLSRTFCQVVKFAFSSFSRVGYDFVHCKISKTILTRGNNSWKLFWVGECSRMRIKILPVNWWRQTKINWVSMHLNITRCWVLNHSFYSKLEREQLRQRCQEYVIFLCWSFRLFVHSEKLQSRTRFANDVNVVTLNIQTRTRDKNIQRRNNLLQKGQTSQREQEFFNGKGCWTSAVGLELCLLLACDITLLHIITQVTRLLVKTTNNRQLKKTATKHLLSCKNIFKGSISPTTACSR